MLAVTLTQVVAALRGTISDVVWEGKDLLAEPCAEAPAWAGAGQPLYRLRGEDADGDVLSFGAQGPEGPELLRFDRVSATEADVFLRHELDREVGAVHDRSCCLQLL